ncbi:host specificity protein [Halovulum dunhuangense]|uniref:Host specificity protein n=1 Tax=Halovulum dunhuangense TaxID=1505036 RepID=A0A849L6A5_9RHOB|nr:glycoside hydrolase/phage tail family protein [Halovulum dunhuangense]NNU81916.1 host specificity protein [Halovulum dunhuangense]
MATVILAAAGGAFGASLGGGVLGLSSAVIGKAAGAMLGAVIDGQVFGVGARTMEVGRRDRLRVMGAREGAPVPRLLGQMRLSGQVIWSSRFVEHVATSGGGKGASAPERRDYSYSVSLAIALCEGEVARIGRIWADGQVIDGSLLDLRLYPGSETQLPDPLIAAAFADGQAPAYRGTAYVVIENLGLGPFGNRIPQFGFEVMRAAGDAPQEPVRNVSAVALVPGTGEYALATEPVSFALGKGESRVLNVNNDQGRADADLAIDNLVAELPACRAVSLVVSWFGSDLRCGSCRIEPKVEQSAHDGVEMPWRVAGLGRAEAAVVGQVEGRPGFGGTPADASVVQAIARLKEAGQAVMFYPFLLMDIRAGNGLPDPWSDAAEQPAVPWRGRITGSVAPGRAGSPDRTAQAGAEVAAFLGQAVPADFAVIDGEVVYDGPAEWSWRRFILHYAHLCAAAGGVDAFCIGSELRGLTQLRDGPTSFPMVAGLRALAADVRAVLGAGTKISYAADWSEYFGYHPADGSGDVYHHLDPLWADPAVDFVGIDNYMPLSDWREGEDHADAAYGAIHDPGYLRANIEGGEGYDWYYASAAERDAQLRRPIEDGAHGEPWVFRPKDLRNWWGRRHFDRPGGARQAVPTDWQPEMKPIWFTEYGCPAVDKGTNQPNVFFDPGSSESALPHYSTGGQDRYIQRCYLKAVQDHWGDPAHNPSSRAYEGRMIDMGRAFAWAWDARPWPDFPRRGDVWSDGPNHALGHWLSGRTHMVALSDAVREICARAGLADVDVAGLHGLLQGYSVEAVESARDSLEPLMLAHGFEAHERDGRLVFRNRGAGVVRTLDPARLAVGGDAPRLALSRVPEAEVPRRVRVGFVHAGQDYQPVGTEAQAAGAAALPVAGADLPVVLDQAEARVVAERWLAETEVARDRISLSLPPSDGDLGPGDVIALPLEAGIARFRIDRVEDTLARRIEAVRVEADLHRPVPLVPELVRQGGVNTEGPPLVELLDLPLVGPRAEAHAPLIAALKVPWSGPLVVHAAAQDHDHAPVAEIRAPSVMGTTLEPLAAALPGRWAEQGVELAVAGGALQSRLASEVLNGANLAALRHGGLGDWEVIQFRDAVLVGPGRYRLAGLLRGQAGTEPVMPPVWPAGTDFVLLSGAAVEVPLALERLGQARHYRVGPAGRPLGDRRVAHLVATCEGVGLRPWAPVHLRAGRAADGAIALGWIRRTRLAGDAWERAEVPLAEQAERYALRVLTGGAVVREAEVGAPAFRYSAAMQAVDGIMGAVAFEVAQISDLYGPGLWARMEFDG